MLAISLTSIPPRFSTLPAVIAALWAQKLKPDRIFLTIPQSYRRFPGPFTIPNLPGVEILRPEVDLGPAGKVLQAAKALRGQNYHLLYCDDDWIYAPDWSAGFIRAADELPSNTAICASGFGADRLGQMRAKAQGFVDIAHGFSGVLIRPEWVTATAFDIPEMAWPVDDIWLSGMLARKNISIWKQAELRNLMSPISDPGNLQDAEIDGQSRADANRQTADYLVKTYGIWTG